MEINIIDIPRAILTTAIFITTEDRFSFEKENLTNDFYNTKVFLGSAFLSKKEIEELDDGSIIELQESWSDYVLIYKDNELIAKGEVMVVDEHFGVKIKEILNRKHNPQFFKNDEKN